MKAIETKYLGPTNTKGARIKAFDCDGNSVTISYPYQYSYEEAHRPAVVKFIEKMGWNKHGTWEADQLACGSTKTGYVWVWDARIVTYHEEHPES